MHICIEKKSPHALKSAKFSPEIKSCLSSLEPFFLSFNPHCVWKKHPSYKVSLNQTPLWEHHPSWDLKLDLSAQIN